jgi:hypothetical protein
MSSLRGVPLSVRLVGNGVDVHIEQEIRDLSFRSTAVGGYASASFALDRPIRQDAPELAVMNKMYVYDARSAEIVWQGNLEDPARSAGSDGLVWAVNAIGPAGRAQDIPARPVYVDRRANVWINDAVSATYIQVGQQGDTFPVWQFNVPRGTVWINGAGVRLTYKDVVNAGMEIARLQATWSVGFTDANCLLGLRAWPSGTIVVTATANGASATLSMSLGGGTAVPAGTTYVNLQMHRITSNLTVADDVHYVQWTDIVVRGKLLDKTGTAITTGYTLNTILASEVVADVLGRMLPMYDQALASIATTSYAIDQLVYTDGATAAEIFDDLMTLEPAYKWAVWSDTVNGKPGFVWDAWPTTVRYEADVSAGFSSPQSSAELFDSVLVKWVDAQGFAKETIVTGTVTALQGVPRRGLLDLGSAAGSAANATQAGTQFLADHSTATNAGTLVVAGRITDLVSGRMLYPWQIRPGYLIRVNGVNARPDSLNATNSNGVTTFRVASTDFSASNGSATLELDSYTPSLARSIAKLTNRMATVRRP